MKPSVIKGSCGVALVGSLGIFLGVAVLLAPSWAGIGRFPPPSSQPNGGNVQPPSARPLGTSLADVALLNAQFVTSGNTLLPPPSMPFQQLYYDFTTLNSSIVSGGLLTTGTNKFTVPTGTHFYVPIQSADDSPPVLGTFPKTPSEAVSYFFDTNQLGGSGSITVDGQTTSIGPGYLVGPILTPPLPDGGGTHIITLGAFLTPLNKGSHTVSMKSRLDGQLILNAGFNFIEGDLTYTVIVQ